MLTSFYLQLTILLLLSSHPFVAPLTCYVCGNGEVHDTSSSDDDKIFSCSETGGEEMECGSKAAAQPPDAHTTPPPTPPPAVGPGDGGTQDGGSGRKRRSDSPENADASKDTPVKEESQGDQGQGRQGQTREEINTDVAESLLLLPTAEPAEDPGTSFSDWSCETSKVNGQYRRQCVPFKPDHFDELKGGCYPELGLSRKCYCIKDKCNGNPVEGARAAGIFVSITGLVGGFIIAILIPNMM